MNKTEFIKALSIKTGKTKKDTTIDVDAFLKTLKEALISDNKIQFIGDFSLSIADTKPRVCRNPKSGEEIQVPAGKKLKIKPGKIFIDEILS
jgi:DNA-binding protein HU-beta